MIRRYPLPFANVSRTPIDTPPVVVETIGDQVRIRTREGGTFELRHQDLTSLIVLLTMNENVKHTAKQLDKYDKSAILALLSEVNNDLRVHSARA